MGYGEHGVYGGGVRGGRPDVDSERGGRPDLGYVGGGGRVALDAPLGAVRRHWYGPPPWRQPRGN